MKRLFLAAFAACLSTCAVPATAQTISGCGTTAIAKGDQSNAARLGKAADCFGKARTIAAAAEDARRARIVAITPKPTPTPSPSPTPAPVTWVACAEEDGICRLPGEAVVRYGASGKFAEKTIATGEVACGNGMFGDPIANVRKACSYRLTGKPNVTPPAPIPTPTPTPTPAPSTPAAPGFRLGVNLTGGTYYSNDPMFTNLLIGSNWNPSGTDFDESKPGSLDALGNPVILPGQQARRILTPPVSVINGTAAQIVCTWDGTGKVVVGGAHWKPVFNANDLTFEWPGRKNSDSSLAWLQILSSDQSDRLRNFDCREKGVARTAVFTADYLASLKPYGLLRFMDLSGVNGNDPNPVWTTRARADGIGSPLNGPGIAIEHMIVLANAYKADAWFNVPWNADDAYVRSMAQLVHDGIPASQHVYVELANEVWNYMFGVTSQAEREGLAKGFASPKDRVEAMLMRYGENTSRVMRIWAAVFADRPGQLVRVSGTQSSNPWATEVILSQGKLAADIDAIAIAPYFAHDLTDDAAPGLTDFAKLDAQLVTRAQRAVDVDMQQQAAVAKKYGKRLIAYEAGQHITGPNVELTAALNRSPRMYDAYKVYLAGWKAKVNDAIALYNATGAIGQYGAWGLREYAGQPIAETPKLRAVQDFAAGK